MLLGPAPVLHMKSQLWLLVLILVINGVSAGMSLIPTFPEILSCAYENGFEEGLSTLGLVSGLFGAMWSVGCSTRALGSDKWTPNGRVLLSGALKEKEEI